MSILHKPCLIISASYEPLSITTARRGITLMVKDVAIMEETYGKVVYPGIELPSVIRLKVYKHIPVRIPILSRKNLYIRDRYRCGYCGTKYESRGLTLDHIIPASRGGKSSWVNLITCCYECNRKKDNKTPEEANMPLLRRPKEQTIHTSKFLIRLIGGDEPGWRKYLYYDENADGNVSAMR